MNLNSLEINHDHFPSMSSPNFRLSGGSLGYWTACNNFKCYCTHPYCDKAHNRCTKETFLIGSDVDVNIFSAFRIIPSGTIDIILKSCILIRHKLRQSQIATLLPQFVICRNWCSRPWRGMLTPITLKMCYGYLGEYPCSLLTWIWKVSYLPILVLFHW